jgi:hypothetical protein
MSTAAAQAQSKPRKNKFEDTPCEQEYNWLQECAIRKGLVPSSFSPKEQLQNCPSETDHLIRCIHRHPRVFAKEKG